VCFRPDAKVHLFNLRRKMTVEELVLALDHARDDAEVLVAIGDCYSLDVNHPKKTESGIVIQTITIQSGHLTLNEVRKDDSGNVVLFIKVLESEEDELVTNLTSDDSSDGEDEDEM